MKKFEENDITVIKLVLRYVIYGMIIHYSYKIIDSFIFILQKMYT